MRLFQQIRLRHLFSSLVFAVFLGAILPPTSAAEREVLRVCSDPNNLPFSHQNQQGFENRVAEILAADLSIPLEYTWFPQRRGFIRNTLRAEHPSREGFKCDLVMGVPDGFERVITTKPYYRSTYALAYVKGTGLDHIHTGQDFLDLDSSQKQQLRIGIFEQTPGAVWLSRHGMTKQAVAYPTMSGDPDEYPGELIEKELTQGRLDAVIVWGPIAGYFAKQAKDAVIAVIPLQSEPGIKFDFAISMGVRFGEGQWKQELETLIDRNAEKIAAVLANYNVPQIAEDGSILK